jgi:HPt (histidine-containing phosphotransfer) domain-containing protein
MSDAFDENALMDRVDGDVEFLEETIAMLGEDSPSLLEQIRAAAASGDAAALVKPAHALKGMLANFCAPAAEAAARELEMMGREGQLTDVEAAADIVQRETARLEEALHQFLRTKTE